jgi:hypothetical protein
MAETRQPFPADPRHPGPESTTAPAHVGSPCPPHSAHVPLEQTKAAFAHVFPAQHASPGPPQASHTFVESAVVTHETSPAVQPTVAQQFCPAPPHTAHPPSAHALPQLELSHRPPFVYGQTEPDGVHTLATQQPPALHPVVQHASPGPPHTAQKLLALHTVPTGHALFAPQTCPGASPAARHSPLTQVVPLAHVAPPPQPAATASWPES